MITTVTLNASIDKAYVMEQPIENGTVMRVKEVRNTAGGKGLNVAKVAHISGAEVCATGFAGGFNGMYLEALAKQAGVECAFFHVEGETRSCINILDPKYGSTEYLEPGFSVEEKDLTEFFSSFRSVIKGSSVVTMSGSAPQGVRKDIYRDLIRICREEGIPVLLDTSGEYLKEGMKEIPFFIKPNRDELGDFFQTEIHSVSEAAGYARKLKEQYGIPWITISLGAEGALLAADHGCFHGKPPEMNAENPVGCGDSMVGAMAVAVERGLSPEEALRYAVAVSAAAAVSKFTGDYDKEVFEATYQKVSVEEVK